VQGVFIASISQAIMPIYLRMWDEKGPEETVAFIGQSLRNYALFGAPIIAGMALVGPDLLPSMATDEYAGAAHVLPWVIAGMVVDGTTCMLGAGLFIQRKTRTIMAIVPTCALLNIVLNLLLVPRIGIVGSAIATLVSYAATSLAMAFYGRNLLCVPIPWATLLRAGLAALAMYEGLIRVYPGQRLLTVAVRTVLGAMLYVSVLLCIDSDARSLWRQAVARLKTGRKEYVS
jgi:O-antigen/teichoic acid export membrane protein